MQQNKYLHHILEKYLFENKKNDIFDHQIHEFLFILNQNKIQNK
jgi:hypothetical protein